MNRAPALGAVVPVFEGVDVGDVGLRGQALEEGVIAILAVGAEHGVLVGRVGFTVQQEGKRHKDSRLYWGSGMSNAAKSLREREVSQGAFMVVRGVPLGEWRDIGKLSARWREGRRWHL